MLVKWIGAVLLLGALAEVFRLARAVRREAGRPVVRGIVWFSLAALAVALLGAWMIDQANAGIRPERMTLARLLLANGLLFWFVGLLAALSLGRAGQPGEGASPGS